MASTTKTRRHVALFVNSLLVATGLTVGWTEAIAAQEVDNVFATTSATADELTVRTNLEGIVGERTPIRLDLSRPLTAGERGAVFIDDADVSALFRRTAAALIHDGALPLLRGSEPELVVYLVKDGKWTEVHRQAVRVGDRLGFVSHDLDPGLTIDYSRELGRGETPDPGFASDSRQQIGGSLELRTRHVRGGSDYSMEAMVLGVEDRQNALRYGELLADAPKYDLASYTVRAGGGPAAISFGHVSAAGQRHLVSGLSSRGATLELRPFERAKASFAALGGSQVVGWDNLLGLSQPDHRILTGGLSLDVLNTPGKLRLQLHGLSGAVLPQNDFNSAGIVDAERSRGASVSLSGSAADQHLRFDVGVARSAFSNPSDPLLEQGFDVVDVAEKTRTARYAEASLDLIQNGQVGEHRSVRMTVGGRYEEVDPQFRSLGAYAAADRRNESVDLQGDLAGVSIQASYSRARNNLANVASILTTRTRTENATVRIPVADILLTEANWLPTLGASVSRTHQFAINDPVGGGFSASHIPDQLSLSKVASVDWQLPFGMVGYRWSWAGQDNRQEGRENADFETSTHAVTVSANPHNRISASVDVGEDRSTSLEEGQTDVTLQFGLGLNLRLFERSTLALQFSDTGTDDLLRTRGQMNSSLNAQWSSYLPSAGLFEGRYFLRFGRSNSRFFDLTFQSDDRRRMWTLDLGASISFFQR